MGGLVSFGAEALHQIIKLDLLAFGGGCQNDQGNPHQGHRIARQLHRACAFGRSAQRDQLADKSAAIAQGQPNLLDESPEGKDDLAYLSGRRDRVKGCVPLRFS